MLGKEYVLRNLRRSERKKARNEPRRWKLCFIGGRMQKALNECLGRKINKFPFL